MPTLVSVGLPIYNASEYLEKTLDSIAAQDYPDFELIICDNASTDSTGEICRTYAMRDRRIRYHRSDTNIGMYLNFNRAVDFAKGPLFIWAGGHDYWDRNLLSESVRPFNLNPEIVLCSPQYRHMDEANRQTGITKIDLDTRGLSPPERFRRMLSYPHFCFAVYSMMKTGVLRKTDFFSEAFFSDRILWMQLSLLGEFYFTDKTFINLRTLPKRDAFEVDDPYQKVVRLIPIDRVRSRSGFIMARFPFCQLTWRVLKALYRSSLNLGSKIRLSLSIPRQWKINALSELTLQRIPKSIRKFFKKILVIEKNSS